MTTKIVKELRGITDTGKCHLIKKDDKYFVAHCYYQEENDDAYQQIIRNTHYTSIYKATERGTINDQIKKPVKNMTLEDAVKTIEDEY